MITLHVLPLDRPLDEQEPDRKMIPVVWMFVDLEPTAEQLEVIKPEVEKYVKLVGANKGMLLIKPKPNTGCLSHSYYKGTGEWHPGTDVLTAGELVELCGTITIDDDGSVDDDTLPSTAAVA